MLSPASVPALNRNGCFIFHEFTLSSFPLLTLSARAPAQCWVAGHLVILMVYVRVKKAAVMDVFRQVCPPF
ncbi:hypothetical protein EDC91_11655 [Shewanella fodinae]|uniref:Uncharacterized protein n=1 Tax=Shewanella fodinae TaxID=552357 RepID=A0A4R2F7P9_9GAMM|nr:hypothetical protein EDC91_11655 [Shewanella fodinae]